jgi:hypothetical protein
MHQTKQKSADVSSLAQLLQALGRLQTERLRDASPESRFHKFLEAFSKFQLRSTADSEATTPSSTARISLDEPSFANFLGSLRPLMDAAIGRGEFVNVWAVVGLRRDELRITTALAWLLDCKGNHGRKSAILEALLQRLANKTPGIFPLPTRIGRPYRTRTEVYPLANQESRVDIELEGPDFLAFIEVKVDALESAEQVSRYIALAEQKASGRPFVVLFLSPENHPQLSVMPQMVLRVSWHDIAGAINDVVANEKDFVSELLRQFAHYAARL